MSGWNREISEAYTAGVKGEPCPNDFVAAYRQGADHRERRMRNCDHNEMVETGNQELAWKCAKCGHIYGGKNAK